MCIWQSIRSRYRHLLLATALCLAANIAYTHWIAPRNLAEVPAESRLKEHPGILGRDLIDDEQDYLLLATHFAFAHCYCVDDHTPSALRLPGYPLFVAGLFTVDRPSVHVAIAGNELLVTLLPILTFVLASSLFGTHVATIAAYLCVANPGLYYLGDTRAYSEPLFSVFLIVALIGWERVQSHRTGVRAAAITGLIFGALLLTRPGYLGLPICVVLAQYLVRGHKSLTVKSSAICLITCYLLVTLWPLRNVVRIGAPVFSTTNDGITLLGTVLAAEKGRGDWINPRVAGPQYAAIQDLDDGPQKNALAEHEALNQLISVSKLTLAKAALLRVMRLWIPLNRIVTDQVSRLANLIINLFYLPLWIFAIVGFFQGRKTAQVVPLLALCSYMTLLAVVSWGSTRFRYGVEPLIALFAARGITCLMKRKDTVCYQSGGSLRMPGQGRSERSA